MPSRSSNEGCETKKFTPAQLKKFDGSAGRPVYIAYEGLVYDVTELFTWKDGEHFAHLAGGDLTSSLEESPHTLEELLPLMKRIGVLVEKRK